MKKRIILGAVLVIGAIALVAGFSSCDFVSALVAPTVNVVSAKDGNGISGVTVTLRAISLPDGKTQSNETATSASDGSVTFANDVEPGKYEVTAVKSGYVFIPVVVDIAGWNQALGTIYGLEPTNSTDVSVFLTWGSSQDVDAHLTYPSGFESTSSGAWAYPATFDAYADFGGESRTEVYYSNKQTSSEFAFLDVDNTTGSGPETVTMNGVNSGTNGSATLISVGSSTPYGLGDVLTAGNYYWMGWAEYYIDAYTGTLATTNSADSAEATVYVTQGTSVIGKYTLPTYMDLDTISVFRAHLFYSSDLSNWYLVFYPDLKITDGGTSGIKSAAPIFVASGSK